MKVDEILRFINELPEQDQNLLFQRISELNNTYKQIDLYYVREGIYESKPIQYPHCKHRKWIKQHLRIKKFYGTSFNAVYTQIWIAVSVYLLLAIIKKRLKLEQELYTILQIFRISLFEKVPLNQLFNESDYRNIENDKALV